jgi:hypothetical protein
VVVMMMGTLATLVTGHLTAGAACTVAAAVTTITTAGVVVAGAGATAGIQQGAMHSARLCTMPPGCGR